jgi:serine O-acetyltransferase
MLNGIRQDFRRCGRGFYSRVKEVFTNPAMWAVFWYRLLRWFQITLPRPVRWVFAIVTVPLHVFIQLLTHVQLPPAVQIGPGLYLPHLGFIVVGSGATIGKNCTLCHGVTIGHARGRNKTSGTPILGDRVYVGPGAIIIGPITIGDDALIGAGAVVVKSVPGRGVVVGNPARVVSQTGSFDLIEYPGMEIDPERIASQAAGTNTVKDGDDDLAFAGLPSSPTHLN